MSRTRRALLLALLPILSLPSCKPPPITCLPGHEAREETMCPACPTIDDPPPGYCPCTKGWVCRETEEHAAERRAAQARGQQDEAHEKAVEEARQKAIELEKRSLERENTRRMSLAIGHYCEGDGSCPVGQWSRLEEDPERSPTGQVKYREVCVPFDGVVQHPPCADPEKERIRKEMEARSVAAFGEARALCAQKKKCRPAETLVVQFVCIHPPSDPEPGRHVGAEPSCAMLASPTPDEGRIGCTGQLVVEAVCKPPDPPSKPGVRRPN